MNIENLQIKGQLAESKTKLRNLETEASGYIILIRSLLNPYEDDISKIESAKVLSITTRLNELVVQIKQLKEKIQKLEGHFE